MFIHIAFYIFVYLVRLFKSNDSDAINDFNGIDITAVHCIARFAMRNVEFQMEMRISITLLFDFRFVENVFPKGSWEGG